MWMQDAGDTMTTRFHPWRAAPDVAVLTDEGFRLFFPLAAVHAAAWPFLWVVAHDLDLPLAQHLPPSLWHAHEMLTGSFGAALIGFITTAIPEFSDTERLRGRPLLGLALLWGMGRLVGLLGSEPALVLAAICDLAWLGALAAYIAAISIRKRTSKLTGFLFWIAALWIVEAVAQYAFATRQIEMAQIAVHVFGFAFLALLGLALARITVPVTNLVLDPTEDTSPFRPHPGRLNLAPGLIGAVIAGELAGLSEAVTGFLFIAAGAAFLDRVAEAFIGSRAARAEILGLAGASALAGCGLLLIGAARLGAPVGEIAGLHVALMGGLGLGVLIVQSIAGLRHCGFPLGLSWLARLSLLCLVAALALRIAPELGFVVPGSPHALASVLWAAAFLLWLTAYWPLLSDPTTIGTPQ
jgi:uncharacterized protein involved in response to NO